MNLFYPMKGKGHKQSKNSPKDAAYYQQQLGEQI
jgi:hypothetical protein